MGHNFFHASRNHPSNKFTLCLEFLIMMLIPEYRESIPKSNFFLIHPHVPCLFIKHSQNSIPHILSLFMMVRYWSSCRYSSFPPLSDRSVIGDGPSRKGHASLQVRQSPKELTAFPEVGVTNPSLKRDLGSISQCPLQSTVVLFGYTSSYMFWEQQHQD